MKSPSRRVRVVLAFSAHEPMSARRLPASALGRLVAVAEALSAPVSLAISNELAHQLHRDLPDTFAELQRGYAQGHVRPLYTPAHRAPSALLSPDELADELRLNEECVHGLLGAPLPTRRGVLFSAGEIDPRLVPTVEERGVDFTLCPRGAVKAGDASYDYSHRPFRVGERLIALPLHDAPLPPDRDASVVAIRNVLAGAPAGSVVVFLHRLDELELVRHAWGVLKDEVPDTFELTAPAELLEADEVTPPWLPLVELEARADCVHGWEGGRFVTGTLEWLVAAFGFQSTPPLGADALFEQDYQLERLPPRAQVPMLLRLVKAGCAESLDGEAGVSKRPYLDGFRICDVLDAECQLADTQPAVPGPLAPGLLEGLARMPELIVDPRVVWLQIELEQMQVERGLQQSAGFAELDRARASRQRADEELSGALQAYAELRDHQFHGRSRWRALLQGLRDYLGSVCVALDYLERAAAAPADPPTARALSA